MESLKKPVYHLALLIVMTMFAFSCKPETEKIEEYFTISDEFKSYTYFKKGSYWVYQNINSKQKDSISIDSAVTYLGVNGLDLDDNEPFKYDAIEEFFKGSEEMNYWKWEIAASNTATGSSYLNELLRLYFKNGMYHIILYPRVSSGEEVIFGGKDGTYETVGKLGSYTVNGVTYEEVYHTRVLDTYTQEESYVYDFYIAKNFGIIRQVISNKGNTDTWDLIKSNIIQ